MICTSPSPDLFRLAFTTGVSVAALLAAIPATAQTASNNFVNGGAYVTVWDASTNAYGNPYGGAQLSQIPGYTPPAANNAYVLVDGAGWVVSTSQVPNAVTSAGAPNITYAQDSSAAHAWTLNATNIAGTSNTVGEYLINSSGQLVSNTVPGLSTMTAAQLLAAGYSVVSPSQTDPLACWGQATYGNAATVNNSFVGNSGVFVKADGTLLSVADATKYGITATDTAAQAQSKAGFALTAVDTSTPLTNNQLLSGTYNYNTSSDLYANQNGKYYSTYGSGFAVYSNGTSSTAIGPNGIRVDGGAGLGSTLISGGTVTIVGGTTNSNIGGNVNTLTTNAALNVTGGAVVNNGLVVNDGLRVTGPSQGASAQTIDMGGNRVQDVASPINPMDAANKAYVDRGLAKAYEGTAMALAISQPIFAPGQSWAVRAGWGGYEGQNAFGLSAAGIIARDWLWGGSTVAIDGGIGFADAGAVAGKAGVTIGFGASYVPMK